MPCGREGPPGGGAEFVAKRRAGGGDRKSGLARSEGVTLEVYLERLASQRSLENASRPPLSGEELDRLLDAEAASDSTYQGTYSRADIYRDRS